MSTAPRDLASGRDFPAPSRDPVVVVESTIAVLAIVLAMTLVVASIPDKPPASTAARRDPPAAASDAAPAATTDPVPPVPVASAAGSWSDNLGFEAGMAGWLTTGGARVERVSAGREGTWAASIERGSSASPGITLPRAWRCGPGGRSYVASVWLRASAPRTAVTFSLFELAGGRRYLADRVATVLAGTGWQRLERTHLVRRPGSWLGVEVVARGLPPSASLLVDGLDVHAR
ncbi:MAG TPA: hypothetical protein VF486_25665 [Actinomycetes bacterium]